MLKSPARLQKTKERPLTIMSELKWTMADIFENPKAYQQATGIEVPTFDEYAKNPEKYKGRKDEIFVSAENGPQLLRKVTRRAYYYVGKYKVDSLEKAEKVAKDMGWNLSEMEYKPNLENVGGGKFDVHVHFVLRDNGKAQG